MSYPKDIKELNEYRKNEIRRMYLYFFAHPKEYLRYFGTGRVVPLTYQWKRRIEKEKEK